MLESLRCLRGSLSRECVQSTFFLTPSLAPTFRRRRWPLLLPPPLPASETPPVNRCTCVSAKAKNMRARLSFLMRCCALIAVGMCPSSRVFNARDGSNSGRLPHPPHHHHGPASPQPTCIEATTKLSRTTAVQACNVLVCLRACSLSARACAQTITHHACNSHTSSNCLEQRHKRRHQQACSCLRACELACVVCT